MTTLRPLSLLLGVAALMLAGVTQASAQPDITVVSVIEDTNGFGTTCSAPCFSVEKTANVFFAGNPSAPGVCGPTDDTYTYTLTHTGGTFPSPGIPVTEFEMLVDTGLLTGSGSIAGGGVAPVSVTPGVGVLSYAFPGGSACPSCLDEGKTSEVLYVCADGATTDPGPLSNIVSTTAILLDAQGQCIAPVPAVATCEIIIDKKCCVSRGDTDEGSDSDSGSSDEKPGEDCRDFDDDSDSSAADSSEGSSHSKSHSGSDSSGSDDRGPTFDDACTAESGATIVYGYLITNQSGEKLKNVVIDDDKLGQINRKPKKLKNGKSKFFKKSTVLFTTTTNTATVTGEQKNSGDTCVGQDSVTVTITP